MSIYTDQVSQEQINELASELDATGEDILRNLYAAYLAGDESLFDFYDISLDVNPSFIHAVGIDREIIEIMREQVVDFNIASK